MIWVIRLIEQINGGSHDENGPKITIVMFGTSYLHKLQVRLNQKRQEVQYQYFMLKIIT